MSYALDEIDRQLVQATQAGLPMTTQPFVTLAEQLSLPLKKVLERMQAMQNSGAIRRIALVPNHYKIGYVANGMSVWDIADEDIAECGHKIGTLPFVSHCYQRPRHLPDWPYNLFAMVHAKTRTEANEKVQQIANLLGDKQRAHDVLFSNKILKKTGMRIKDRNT